MSVIYALRYTPESIDELQGAIDNFNKFTPGLGVKFLKEFEAEIEAISKHPYARAIRYEDVRFALIKRFHYAIHYTVKENSQTLIVQGVFSTWRDPSKTWQKRIE